MPFKREIAQQQNAARYAVGGPPMLEQEGVVDPAEAGDKAPVQEIPESDDEMGCKDASNDRETRLKDARATHVQRALEDTIRFVERPALKTAYIALFSESLLIQQRSSFRRPGREDKVWRHGWFYDCCADQEPKITEQCKKHVINFSPQPDAPVSKMFFESALTVAGDNDVLIAPNSRSNGASKVLTKHLEKATHYETLCLVYKEHPGKGRQTLMETVHAAGLKPFGLQPAEARLHYQLTTTTSDAIVQVQDLEEPLLVEVQEKEAILGREQLLAQEKMLKPTDKTVLFHWEKRMEVYEEMFHHFHLTSITAASCGRLQMLQACLRMNIKCLALYRTEVHLKLMREDLLAWMTTESESNPRCHYYLKRDDLIEQLGLDPDDAAVGQHAAGLGDASSVGEDDNQGEPQKAGKDDNQEEPEEEGEDDEEPEEEEEKEAEEDDQEPEEAEEDNQGEPAAKKHKGEGQAKGKGKAKAKGKAKSKAQGKAKAKAKAKVKGKAKGKAKSKPEQAQSQEEQE